jgi:hypothetical protein
MNLHVRYSQTLRLPVQAMANQGISIKSIVRQGEFSPLKVRGRDYLPYYERS